MDQDIDNPLEDGLVFDTRIPFQCSPRASGDQETAHRRDRNERLLQSLSLLDEHHTESQEEDREWMAEINRLEAKIDLLISMVSRLTPDVENMPVTALSIGALGLAWHVDGVPAAAAGDAVWLALSLDSRLPDVVKLPALVTGVIAKDGDQVCVARYVDQGDQVSDLIEKIIFKHHRRAVAEMRAKKASE